MRTMGKNMHQYTYQCNVFNIDGLHAHMEMLLSSLFDGSFINEPRTITATNRALKYRITKNQVGLSLTVTVLSPSKMTEPFLVECEGQPFPIRRISSEILDLSLFP